ncbi:AAA family ATPase [Lentzea chajnantorensis]
MPPRLIHLNGPTGVGKSTLAARYAADHPLTLNLDADRIVGLVGGWQDDFFATVDLVRPLALTMAAHHLRTGHDVVMPQLITRRDQRDVLADAVSSAGARYVEVVLLAPRTTAITRFEQRDEPIDAVVRALGGQALIHQVFDDLRRYLTPGTTVIDNGGLDVEQTYTALLAALG